MSDNDFLQHYGVPGMKWGKWNAETARKYAGGRGRAKRSFRTNISSKASDIKKKQERAKREGERKAFEALREQTLKSHDPEIIEKGMHTLTDAELISKIDRLEKEKRIRDLSSAKKNAELDTAIKKENYRRTKKERRASGLSGSMIKSTYNATVNYAGKSVVDKYLGVGGKKSKKKAAAAKAGEMIVEELFSKTKNPVGFA